VLTTPLVIDPRAVYREGELALALGVRLSALSRARREGRLRFKREGQALLILGQWVLDRLDTAEKPEVPHAG
jgi:hypothetical protein